MSTIVNSSNGWEYLFGDYKVISNTSFYTHVDGRYFSYSFFANKHKVSPVFDVLCNEFFFALLCSRKFQKADRLPGTIEAC